MIEFKDIALEDKSLFDSYFSTRQYGNSEFTFTNLFIWRQSYNFKYSIINDHLCIIGKYRKLYPFAFAPLSLTSPNYDCVIPILADCFISKGYPLVMKSITSCIKASIEEVMAGKFIFKSDRSNFDYIYLTDELIGLKGKKFHQKRNHVNKFIKSYEFQYEKIDGSNVDECLSIEAEWANKRNGDESINEEKNAILEAFSNYKALKLKGGALRVNGSIQAFTLGELLNSDTAVIHIEKANIEYSGCFAAINQQFAANAWSDTTYVNREEDMGIPGLRKAKESYNPVKMVEKYTGFFL